MQRQRGRRQSYHQRKRKEKLIMQKLQWFVVGLIVLLGGAFLAASVSPRPVAAQALINPADFTLTVNNAYFTLVPGTTFNYKRSGADGSTETVKTIVTNRTRAVMGVQTVVIWDRAWLDGKLIEDTYDWYAQDKAGNVWYFGEDTKQYKDGTVIGTKGSWEGGVNGAQPGIIMKAKPQVGDSYRQEYSKGIAEDVAAVLALNQAVSTPAGSYTDCLQTLDTSALDPKLQEHKYYCPQAGGNVTLVVDTTNNEREELVSLQTSAESVSPAAAAPSAPPAASPGMPVTGGTTGLPLLLALALAGLTLLTGGWVARRRSRAVRPTA